MSRLHMLSILLFFLFIAPAQANFGFHAGSHFGYGRISGEDALIPARDMGTFDLQFMPGYRLGAGLMVGMLLDYRFMSQLEENGSQTTDFSGRGFLTGAGISYEPGLIKALFSYNLQARHYLSGPDTTYSGSGFTLLFGYEFLPSFFTDLEYVSTTYNAVEIDGVPAPLGTNTIHHWNIGIGISYSY